MKIFQRCDKEKETTITPFDLFYFLDLESRHLDHRLNRSILHSRRLNPREIIFNFRLTLQTDCKWLRATL